MEHTSCFPISLYAIWYFTSNWVFVKTATFCSLCRLASCRERTSTNQQSMETYRSSQGSSAHMCSLQLYVLFFNSLIYTDSLNILISPPLILLFEPILYFSVHNLSCPMVFCSSEAFTHPGTHHCFQGLQSNMHLCYGSLSTQSQARQN